MKNAMSSRSGIRRRTFLSGGIGAGLASMFLRQLEADADGGPPTRFLVIHRPCGTIAERFFPTAGTSDTDFTLGPIMAPLQALKGDMVVFNNLTTPFWEKLPVVLFGGKSLGLQRGRNLQMNGRYLNDVQAAIMLAFGYPLPADNKFAGNNVWKGVTGPRLGQGAVDGLFA
ncbi:MAG TPA: DUF1552 domain-containing protein [Polyangia bacterium]|jgi:hypothetical protein